MKTQVTITAIFESKLGYVDEHVDLKHFTFASKEMGIRMAEEWLKAQLQKHGTRDTRSTVSEVLWTIEG